MANEQNLIPGAHRLTVEEQSKGGEASGKERRRKANLRRAAKELLEGVYPDRNGEERTGEAEISGFIDSIEDDQTRMIFRLRFICFMA